MAIANGFNLQRVAPLHLLPLPDLISIKSCRACLPRQARLHAPARQAQPNLARPSRLWHLPCPTASRLMANEPENSLPESFLTGPGHDPQQALQPQAGFQAGILPWQNSRYPTLRHLPQTIPPPPPLQLLSFSVTRISQGKSISSSIRFNPFNRRSTSTSMPTVSRPNRPMAVWRSIRASTVAASAR